MRVALASEPGAADRPNEDFAAVVPGAAVLLDGAGYVPDAGTGCVPTVIVARQRGGTLEYLVLCDSVLLLQRRQGEPAAITDGQLDETVARLRPAAGTPDNDPAWRAYARRLEAARNQPGGFWPAAADPAAAAYAVTGAEPLGALSAVTLLSDGASTTTRPPSMGTWRAVPEMPAIDSQHAVSGRREDGGGLRLTTG